jgi:hypothetical protein
MLYTAETRISQNKDDLPSPRWKKIIYGPQKDGNAAQEKGRKAK